MIKFFNKNKKQKGYAILFTIVIVSAISVITAGLSNAAYKQLILSSLAKDSQAAFYQADTASDCALYADRVVAIEHPELILNNSDWSCGDTSGANNLKFTNGTSGGFSIDPKSPADGGSTPCFRIEVAKTTTGVSPNAITTTKISAKGYNICDKTNLRTVEREIQTSYQEQS